MKTLYEFTCARVGVSYLRIYAWATSLKEAQDLARSKVDEYFAAPRIEDWEHEVLLTSESVSFATAPSTEGWEL